MTLTRTLSPGVATSATSESVSPNQGRAALLGRRGLILLEDSLSRGKDLDAPPEAVARAKAETPATRPATTPAAVAMSRDLKERGFSFVGPTTAYAFMQAMGLVNDHLEGCWARQACAGAPHPAGARL